jgi:ribonuclease HI
MVKVFTDGACSGNPGPGGWAWVTDDGRHRTGGDPDTTNQRMELTAVLRAVEELGGRLAIHSDSTYVVKCFNDRWYEGWLQRGWKSSQRKPVANRDLWQPLIERYLERKAEITFTWVKGHSGDKMNDLADSLAVAEVERLKERLPAEGPARRSSGDTAGAAGATAVKGPDVPWPVERAIVVTGARELDDEQLEGLSEALSQLDRHNDVIVSGLRLGAELAAAEAAVGAGVPVGVVLPYADPVRVWSGRDRQRFDAAVEASEWLVTLDGDPARPAIAIRDRNQWLWTAGVGAIVVGDDDLASEAELAGLGVIAI